MFDNDFNVGDDVVGFIQRINGCLPWLFAEDVNHAVGFCIDIGNFRIGDEYRRGRAVEPEELTLVKLDREDLRTGFTGKGDLRRDTCCCTDRNR